MEDGCVTEDLQWIVDLHTMRACRMCRFKNSMKIRVVAACPRGIYFLAVVGGKPDSPLMHLSETQLKWLPCETKHATRWGLRFGFGTLQACDIDMFLLFTGQAYVTSISTR